ncbi:ABC transporter permease [Desulfurispora thermophila]|uniref:ABC transporter permease n=1 Tax=Desulfurispora thermophila TaxID=265470 RepID=UPI00037BD301|nr:ABC transporter permease [Desulfurispora thermophila]
MSQQQIAAPRGLLRGAREIARREMSHMLKKPKLLLIMFAFPVFTITLFNLLYSQHVILHIRTAVWDASQTSLSRQVVEAFADSDRFDLVATADSEREVRRLLDTRQVEAALVIPADFARNLQRGQSSKVLVIVNGSNMLFSNAVLSSATEIVSTISAGSGMVKLESMGLPPDSALKTVQPVELALRIWYNPTFNYANFLVLGLLATTIQQVTLLYMATSLVREKAAGTLAALRQQGYSALAVLLGKYGVYFTVNFFTLNLLLASCVYWFKIPFNGNLPQLLLLEVVFLGGILALGTFLSLVSRNELEATRISMMIAMPSFLFSGYTWPVQAMPPLCKVISALLPLTYFAGNLRDIALMDISFSTMQHDLLVLAGLVAVFLPLSALLFRRQYGRLSAENK